MFFNSFGHGGGDFTILGEALTWANRLSTIAPSGVKIDLFTALSEKSEKSMYKPTVPVKMQSITQRNCTEFERIRDYYDSLNRDFSHFACSNDVCTPMECVKEMVDSVPSAFWRKKNIKVFDSCCGNGNFHAYIATKTSLSNLYFNEINAKRVRHLKKYFGERINLTTKDFFAYDDHEQFDMVVSNPPYAKFTNGKRAAKNHNLARDFIRKALNITKQGGYVLFIVPNNWMSFSDRNSLPYLMSKYQFRHLNIHGAKKWFPEIGSSFTWFLLEKTENREPFTVENNYVFRNTQKVTLAKNARFIPLYLDDTAQRIIKKVVYNNLSKYAVQTSSNLHKYTKKHLLHDRQTGEHRFKVRHTPTQTIWSKVPHKYQSGYKVFLSLTNQFGTFIDDCGMTQSIAFIRCKNKAEANRIQEELDHPVYKCINNLTRYGNFNNIRVLQNLAVIGSFSLSKSEERFVEKFNAQYYGD
ncbi:MAG: methyltransferase [Gammaproteobacteria bacterium]|nr:methyltransferase [Gammaproteobacteria bacterium]